MTTLDDDEGATAPLRPWQTAPKAEVPVLPPPEITARPMDRADLTRAPMMLINRLGEGWNWSARYSRGPHIAQRLERGRDGKNHYVKRVEVADTCVLRMGHTCGARAVVLYVAGQYSSGYVWDECTDPDCVNAGVVHPVNLPVPTTATAMAVVISDEPTPGLTEPDGPPDGAG